MYPHLFKTACDDAWVEDKSKRCDAIALILDVQYQMMQKIMMSVLVVDVALLVVVVLKGVGKSMIDMMC